MLSFAQLKEEPKVFKSLIGHNLDEFNRLLESFDQAYDDLSKKNGLLKKEYGSLVVVERLFYL